jgi:hypothetical protein
MGWGDPVVGGVDLRRAAIRSPNYVAGTTGWTINQDGSVEFNNGTFRGTVTASTFQGTDFVINSSGMFVYSGTPAAGNLIASIAPAAGTDSFGNHYVAGFTTYDNVGLTFTNQDNGVFQVGNIVSGVPDQANAALINAGVGVLIGNSGKAAAPNNDAAVLSVFVGQPNTRSGNTLNPIVQAIDSAGTSDVDFWLSGAMIKVNDTGSIYAWQNPTLGSGWSTSAIRSGRPIQFRLDAEDNVVLTGSANCTSTTPANPMFTMPAHYQPNSNQVFLVHHQNSAGSLIGVCTGFVTTAGAVELFSTGTITSGDIFTLNATLPIGQIQ